MPRWARLGKVNIDFRSPCIITAIRPDWSHSSHAFKPAYDLPELFSLWTALHT